MTEVSLEMVYHELKELRKDLELIKCALIPEETLSEDEIGKILLIEKEMEEGEKMELEDALKGL